MARSFARIPLMALSALLSVAGGASLAAPTDWVTIVAAATSDRAPNAVSYVNEASDGLSRAGFVADEFLVSPLAADLTDTLSRYTDRSGVVLYLAAGASDEGLILDDGAFAVEALVAALTTDQPREAVVIIEDCAGATDTVALPILEALPEGLSFAMQQSSADGACPMPTDRVTRKLDQLDRMQSLAGIDALKTEAGTVIGDVLISDADLVEAAPVISVVSDDIILLASFEPAKPAEAEASRRLGAEEETQPFGDTINADGVMIFVAPPQSQITRRERRDDQPEPSIVVGLEEPDETPPEPGETLEESDDPLSGDGVSWANTAAREKIREEQPDLYLSLVNAGAFDPEPSYLVRAIQTELTRLNCYDYGIDGEWGGGSIGGLNTYYKNASGDSEGVDPTISVFRMLMRNVEAPCAEPYRRPVVARPAPVARSPKASTGSRPRPQTNRPSTTVTRPRPQTSRPTRTPSRPAPAPSGRTFNNLGGGGYN